VKRAFVQGVSFFLPVIEQNLLQSGSRSFVPAFCRHNRVPLHANTAMPIKRHVLPFPSVHRFFNANRNETRVVIQQRGTADAHGNESGNS